MPLTEAEEAELRSAQSELAQFASNMQTELSTAAPSVTSQEEGGMDVEILRDKRPDTPSEEPPHKWAKGDAKGDFWPEDSQATAISTGAGTRATTIGGRTGRLVAPGTPTAPSRTWSERSHA